MGQAALPESGIIGRTKRLSNSLRQRDTNQHQFGAFDRLTHRIDHTARHSFHINPNIVPVPALQVRNDPLDYGLRVPLIAHHDMSLLLRQQC